MKIICRDINYADFGITEETGWKVSYDWSKLRKIMKKIGAIVSIFTAVISIILVNTIFKEYQDIYIVLSAGIAIILFLFFLTPVHEILHLIPIVGFKLDDKCFIILGKGTVSAFYRGEITNKQNCVSLITPFLILGLILIASSILLSGIFKFCAVLLLIMHVGGCWSDIYMFFYMKRHFSIPYNFLWKPLSYRISQTV